MSDQILSGLNPFFLLIAVHAPSTLLPHSHSPITPPSNGKQPRNCGVLSNSFGFTSADFLCAFVALFVHAEFQSVRPLLHSAAFRSGTSSTTRLQNDAQLSSQFRTRVCSFSCRSLLRQD